jgi:hypothetical protein
VHKGGRHKHETYALTASGSRHADRLVRRFVSATTSHPSRIITNVAAPAAAHP